MIPLTPTAEFPSSFLPPRRVPRLLNRFSHRFVAEMLWRAFRRAINEARVGVCGLPPRSKLWSGHPMLYGISPSLLPKPRDWPSNAYMCGQWLRPVGDWDAQQLLQKFLAAGEAPIYVGFGSMVGFDRNVMRDATAVQEPRTPPHVPVFLRSCCRSPAFHVDSTVHTAQVLEWRSTKRRRSLGPDLRYMPDFTAKSGKATRRGLTTIAAYVALGAFTPR